MTWSVVSSWRRKLALLDHARVHREARTGIPALRAFLVAITGAAGLEDGVHAPVEP
jgi:hypothetical protein